MLKVKNLLHNARGCGIKKRKAPLMERVGLWMWFDAPITAIVGPNKFW